MTGDQTLSIARSELSANRVLSGVHILLCGPYNYPPSDGPNSVEEALVMAATHLSLTPDEVVALINKQVPPGWNDVAAMMSKKMYYEAYSKLSSLLGSSNTTIGMYFNMRKPMMHWLKWLAEQDGQAPKMVDIEASIKQVSALHKAMISGDGLLQDEEEDHNDSTDSPAVLSPRSGLFDDGINVELGSNSDYAPGAPGVVDHTNTGGEFVMGMRRQSTKTLVNTKLQAMIESHKDKFASAHPLGGSSSGGDSSTDTPRTPRSGVSSPRSVVAAPMALSGPVDSASAGDQWTDGVREAKAGNYVKAAEIFAQCGKGQKQALKKSASDSEDKIAAFGIGLGGLEEESDDESEGKAVEGSQQWAKHWVKFYASQGGTSSETFEAVWKKQMNGVQPQAVGRLRRMNSGYSVTSSSSRLTDGATSVATDDHGDFAAPLEDSRTVYVMAGWSGCRAGTLLQPYSSVPEALTSCANKCSNIEVVLLEGDYPPFLVTGSYDSIVIRAEHDNTVNIVPTTKMADYHVTTALIIAINLPQLYIRGLNFKAQFYKCTGIEALGCDDCKVDQCHFYNCTNSYIFDGNSVAINGKDGNQIIKSKIPRWFKALFKMEYPEYFTYINYLLCVIWMMLVSLYTWWQQDRLFATGDDVVNWVVHSLVSFFVWLGVVETTKVLGVVLLARWMKKPELRNIVEQGGGGEYQRQAKKMQYMAKWHHSAAAQMSAPVPKMNRKQSQDIFAQFPTDLKPTVRKMSMH
eukprot:TRINITY_DN63828_c0_g1_i2.p1 TRINITY_DN63828_c0_g1~~TRINITY_DN63828_c0_g1_i2.p1  ORF type:complete len:859 (-),score=166.94 TRINITY_DN63828_c0_g1_i2:1696-3930(-)